ncbi:MAG: spermidine/putrescine ABC transporter substrate-binding protein [Anaerolineae bacterium]|nr:spermidine/putrescine ABC transporter substrate-binding protein [Anaerolineae bacterium]
MIQPAKQFILMTVTIGVVLVSSFGCTPTPDTPVTLILRDWEDDLSPEILAAFTTETGIQVSNVPYTAQEEAVAELRAGQVCDVLVLESQLIPALITGGLLAEIDYAQIPNYKYISANFRDMAFDPGNAHSVPYSWGTTGLVVRTDLVEAPISRWSDLWDARYAGKLMGWNLHRYMIGLTLKSMGYSLNSQSPDELEVALLRLVELKPRISLVDWEAAVSAPYLVNGDVIIAVGQADDALVGRQTNPAITYVMPEEGAILWGDNFVIPAASPHKAEAEQFINFLLRPEISAQIMNETYYWLPNDEALKLIDPELRANPEIFPPLERLKNAEILLPLNSRGEALYADVWERFLAAD